MTSGQARPADEAPDQGGPDSVTVIAGPRPSERTLPDLPAGYLVPFAPRRASPAATIHADREARPATAGVVAAHLTRHKRFPPEARARGERGWTRVAFSIGGAGNVTSVALSGASGITSFERETEAMVRRASPFAPSRVGTERVDALVPARLIRFHHGPVIGFR